jgi:alanyl-tRNA synthetase
VVLDQTPFYAESGGQVGDTGALTIGDSLFEVSDTQKQSGVYLHVGQLRGGRISVGDSIQAEIDVEYRQAVRLNHSSTHLMHEALRKILGEHVQQKGSLVDAEKLRFDFSHYQPLTKDEITQIETWVNDQIRLNVPTSSQLMNMDEAKQTGAMALFGEKYGDIVRVLSIGSDSVELCGGTHVQRTGDIGLFKMTLETGTASGVRRIEAVTGHDAVQRFINSESKIDSAAQALKSNRDDLVDRIQQLQASLRLQEKELAALKSKMASQAGGDLVSQALAVKGIKVLTAVIEDADLKTLRDTVDQLKNKLVAAVVVLASSQDGKVNIIAGVTQSETSLIRAGDIAKFVAEQCGGKGGGRPDMAQAGGTQPENLEKALTSVAPWIESQI